MYFVTLHVCCMMICLCCNVRCYTTMYGITLRKFCDKQHSISIVFGLRWIACHRHFWHVHVCAITCLAIYGVCVRMKPHTWYWEDCLVMIDHLSMIATCSRRKGGIPVCINNKLIDWLTVLIDWLIGWLIDWLYWYSL